ncbi:Caffeoyl-CoA O-methyltransferase 1 [Platanthera guangdongensis]|uniref:norbelladine O-methyltransferase n=1 Tax=Platanthera guangdongensis TaxID=2320717 RepID=A0ABR2LUH8_9ASPA
MEALYGLGDHNWANGYEKLLCKEKKRPNIVQEAQLPPLTQQGLHHFAGHFFDSFEWKRRSYVPQPQQGVIDLVNADKDNYLSYHHLLIDLVKIGGIIAYDNTLWNGSVATPADAPMRKYIRYSCDFVLELNEALAADHRIEICQLPVGDGVALCRPIN